MFQLNIPSSKRRLFVVRAAFILFLALAVVVAFIKPSIESFIVLGIAAVALHLLVRRHAARTRYQCPVCRHEFAVSGTVDLAGPQTPAKKLLECPKCRETSWCTALESRRAGTTDRVTD